MSRNNAFYVAYFVDSFCRVWVQLLAFHNTCWRLAFWINFGNWKCKSNKCEAKRWPILLFWSLNKYIDKFSSNSYGRIFVLDVHLREMQEQLIC